MTLYNEDGKFISIRIIGLCISFEILGLFVLMALPFLF